MIAPFQISYFILFYTAVFSYYSMVRYYELMKDLAFVIKNSFVFELVKQ